MADPNKTDTEIKKVFFITSNQSKLDKYIKYEIPRNRGLINLKAGDSNNEMCEQRNFKREQFTLYINSMEISPKTLNKEDQDPKSRVYKTVLSLKHNRCTFPANINFRANKNNFIYDLQFSEYKGLYKNYDPPPSINLSQLDQLKFYIRYLKEVLKKKQKDQIYKDLVTESQSLSFGKKIFLDFYLEILKNCYAEKQVKLFLKSFNLEKIQLPKEFSYKDYASVLKIIEKNPQIIIKYCSQNEDQTQYYLIFYTLLFFVRFYYEREKANEMIQNKNIWQYMIKILPDKCKYFPKLQLSDEFIHHMFEQNLTVKIITGILSFCGSVEKILILINEKIDLIANCCSKEKIGIRMSSLENPQKTDDLEKIIEEINKIINYEMNNNKVFISFDEEFWNNYIHFNDNVQKLFMINKAIILCSNIDKNLKTGNLNLTQKIHKVGLDSIREGNLKNEEVLDFIKIDTYFYDHRCANKYSRPLDIVKGLDFDTMTENFFAQWNNSNIFKIYSFADNDFKTKIVDHVSDMKHFGKLLKLFDYKNRAIFDNNLVQKLREKFKNVINTYKAETCPKFVEEIAFYIYIIDYQKSYDMNKFMTGTIEKYIPSVETKTDIYVYLTTNHKDISNKVIEGVTDFLTKNKERLNAKSILFLLEKINSVQIIESLLNKIESFTIKEAELFSLEKDIESFQLLEGIQKGKMFNKFADFNKTKYLMNAFENQTTIFKKIKDGEISYEAWRQIFPSKEKREVFFNKLKILFFNNEADVEQCSKILKDKFTIASKAILGLNQLLSILKEFFSTEYKNNITKVEKISNILKSGNLNEIEKPNVKSQVDEANQIFTKEEFEKMRKLKESIFFKQLFRARKQNNALLKKDNEIFEITEKKFSQLKLLFTSANWSKEIEESIIKECFRSIKNGKKNELKIELNRLKAIFEINDFGEEKLIGLEGGIKTFNQKEEIFLTANSCIYFINELEAEHTEFYTELDKIREGLQPNKPNLTLDKIDNFGKTLKNYGLNVVDPTEDDRDYLNILHCIFAKKGSIKFIAKLDNNDIRNLQELVNLSDDSFVTNNEIQDMIKCSTFIHNLGEIKGKKNDKELIKAFINEVPKHKGIGAHFQNYANNAAQIQELLTKNLDKSQATLQQIKDIMKASTFSLSIDNNQDPYLKFEGEFKNGENQEVKKINNYDDINELRERAMLTRKLGDDKSQEEKKIFNLYKLFSERVGEIEKINQLLTKLGEKGYSENIKIVIDIKENIPSFSIDDKNMENYKNCSTHLDSLNWRITDIQTRYYKNEELIRYVYGRQFNLLNSCLRKERNNALVPFLKFLTNDQVDSNKKLKEIEFGYDYELDENKYVCLFENIKKFLGDFLKSNNLTLETIYKQNIIKQKYQERFHGLFTYLPEDDKIGEVQKGIEEHILNWFYFLTDHPPMAQTVLLCNEETTSEEITAFMYRAFMCKYPVFFMIGKIELLTSEKRQTLTRLINTLFINKGKEMKSCVAFAYSERNDSLVRYLENIRLHENMLKHEDKKKQGEITYDENVEIISSDRAGVGKSTQIKLKVKSLKKKYIHFPFGGEFSRKDVINRLKKIQDQISNEENTVIHLDLYDSKLTELMKDFLYSFLITKLYGQNENLFYLSKKVQIIIEIPCGFVDFFKKFPLLSMFKNRNEMKIADLPPLIVEKNLDSNIQIVCNYLKLLKSGKLPEKDLIITNVSLSKDDIKMAIGEDIFSGATILEAQSLSDKECDTLIKDLIKKELGIQYPTYYQIISFINVLSGQLKNFSMTFALSAEYLSQAGKLLGNQNFKSLRETMVKGFIQNTIHFTQGAFDKILRAQEETYKVKVEQGAYDENKQEEVAVKALSEPGDIISCNKIDPALIFFHEGGSQDFTIITRDNPNKDEYSKLLGLRKNFVIIQNEFWKSIGLNNKLETVPNELKRYTKFEHQQFLEEICAILSLKNPVYTKDKEMYKDKKLQDPDKLKLKSIEEIVGEYVFTADNFIKMVLILLRIRENIPVIMMGETGCGKTSLIRKLSELINNGESQMEILNIHAGITDEEIVKFLFEEKENSKGEKESVIQKALKLEKKEEEQRLKFKAREQKYFKKKFWVFLDEINTCNCMGLICEMMTKHTCQGVELPPNIFFIGACNPYRYGKKGIDTYALKVEGVKEKNLVYTVNPLPFSLLNFVFNFGNLTPDDEERYIQNMVVSPIENFFWKDIKEKNKGKEDFQKDYERRDMNKLFTKEEFDLCKHLKELSKNAIVEAQNYVRKRNDVSSVSLREIRRFSIFYEFFVEYFRKNKALFENVNQKENVDQVDTFYKNLDNRQIYLNSIKLSIYLCYYMRLSNKEFRKELALKMNKIFGDNFVEVPEHEQQYIAKNIEMKKGIAKNRALLENLFTIFACVNAKVPLFIVGKPGCSKSLSVQLLFGAMKGDASDNILFKSLPKLFINSYQGSLGSTSKGVLNIFKKARNLLKNNDNLDKIISMIYFDEMGLAEHSPNNPLKVIHAELEYDLNEGSKKIAFVGISNWILDASKMNRGLYLSIPQPDQKDLETTALTIAESYNEKLAQDNKDLFIALANTYCEYKHILEKSYTIKEDFHGSRDFYHLIKTAMRQLLEKKEGNLDLNIDENVKQEVGINSIERNFAGLEFDDGKTSLEIIKKTFKQFFVNCDVRKEYNVLKTICENIKDKDSRYLLLVSKSSISNYLLNSILTSTELKKELNKELSFYIGSGFTRDIHSEGYGLKILNKIQLQMEQNKILLLTDLEAVYPSLYDLFNQNFTVVSKKNYARIAMGSTNNTFSLVDDGFKCIVLVDEQALKKAEAPFLNRFEKHIISFEYLLSKEFIKEADNIYNMIQDFSNPHLQENKLDIKYNLSYLLINSDKEEIQGIIYSKQSELQKEGKKLLVQDCQDLVLEKIALTLPQDVIFVLKNSGFEQKYPKIADKIIDFYQRGEHRNLVKFLQTMKNTKNVIYTFTSIDEPLYEKISDEIETELLGKIACNNIEEIPISSLYTENDLESKLDEVYSGKGNMKKIIILKFNPYETGLMNYIKFFIENYIKEKNYLEENNKKVYIFSVHMNRIFEADEREIEKDPKKKKFVERNLLNETISHLSDFYQIFIDDLGRNDDFTIIDIMKLKEEELLSKCLRLREEFNKSVFDIFSYFNYNFNINIEGVDKNNYPEKVRHFLKNNKELAEQMINSVLKRPTSKIDIGEVLKKSEFFQRDDVSIISVVERYLSKIFNDNLTRLIFKLEKDNFFSSFIYNQIYAINDNHPIVVVENNEQQENKDVNIIKIETPNDKNEIKEDKNEIKEDKNEIKEEKKEEEKKEEIVIEIKEEKDKNEIKEEKKEEEKKEEKVIEIKEEEKKEENVIEIKEENVIEIKENIKEENKEEPKQELNYYLNNNLVRILIETYLDNVNFALNKVNKNMKNNKVSLLLGLRLPGIYIPLKEINKYIKNEIKNKYFQAERDIIDLREEEGFDLGKELDRCRNRVRSNQKNTEIEILKNKIFEKLNGLENKYQKDSHEFYDLLMEDYYLIFLSENLPDIKEVCKNIEDYKNLLKLMIHQRFYTGDEGEEIDPIKAISKKMVWMESYSEFISIILNIYRKISNYEKNVFNKIDKLIKNREIFLEEDDGRNPHHTIELKSSFYYVIEALLRISIDLELFKKLKGQEFYDFINLLKTITKDSLVINDELCIYSKEIFTIQEFLEIEEGLNNVNKSNVDNIIKVLSILLDISKINNQNIEVSKRGQDLSNYITQLYDFLINNLGDTEKFREIILGIFVRELKKIKNEDYGLTLLNMIVKNNNLIVYSYPFMSIIISRFVNCEPDLIGDNLRMFQDDQGPLLELINNANNDLLNEILLSIFENKINIFFESIPNLSPEDQEEYFNKYYDYINKNDGKVNPTFILSDKSLELFKDCANLLENIYKNRKEGKKEIKNDLICELYAIAYIKIYLSKYAHFSNENNQEFIYFEEVLNAINGNAKTEVRQMMKIYVFKVFFDMIKNYQEFSNYNYKNHQINFFEEFRDRFVEKKEAMLNYYMLPNNENNKLELFKEEYEKFDTYKFHDFAKPVGDFVNYIINNGFDLFYMISTDLIISNLALPNYVKDSNEYTKYSSYVKNVLSDPKIKLPKVTKDLFFLYSNEDDFNNTMKEGKIKGVNTNQFEILLYALRFCLKTTNVENPNGLLYAQLITPESEKKLNENVIPGNNISDNIYVQNYLLLEKHLIIDNKASNIGAYVCGCGLYYDIGPCGFPNWSGVCVNCGKKIGNGPLPPGITGGHGFAHEPGHLRIFKDQAQKQGEFAKYGDNDRNIPNMLIADYKRIKIDPIMEKEKYGVSKVTKLVFQDIHQKVRKLSQIGYRLLNFILYSHLFYANCLKFIPNENMDKYICGGMNIIQMLENDWNFLKDGLQSKGIQIIQIFMNLIFDKLSEKLKTCKEIKTTQDREKFEDEVEKLLEQSYKEYDAYSKIYSENNEKLLQLDKNSMKSLVLETNDIKEYDENDYPFYKYFLMTTYPSKQNFIDELQKVPQYERKYPLLANYLKKDNKEKFLLKYIPEFNEFCNFMIDYYSYKISRDDASQKILKEEELYKNDDHKFKDKFKSFTNIWNKHLKPYAIKYGCRDEMPPIDLNESLPVANFLNDNGDICKGMYIAAAYQNFIEWQNNFLDSLIEPLKQSGILHHFVKNMEHVIDIQKAKKNEALNFDIVEKDFNVYIYENCRRNIFRKDNSINYMNYKQFVYDFDSIEKYLGELLLPGKVKFNSYDKLKYVTFCFEGFRGDKSSVLTDFAEKYKQTPLSLEYKQIIYNIINENYNDQPEKLSNILFSIQLLIYYLTQDRQREKDEIKTIVGDLPDHVKLSEDCVKFLQEPALKIKFEDLIGVYSFFELLCFKPIINNLQDHYKKDIKEEDRKKILSLFEEKKFKLITKKDLASACRKFISRYLVSTRKDTDYNENNDLSVNLARYEFWPANFFDKGNEDIFNNEINNLKVIKISTGQCYELYNLLGGDETDELKGIKIKKDDVKEGGDGGEDEDQRIVNRERNKRGHRRPKPKY